MSTEHGASRSVRRVAIVGPSDLAILRNRDSLIRALVERRQTVLCVAPAFDPDRRRALNLMGAETIPFEPPPARIRFLDGWQRERALAALLSGWRADAVLGFGVPSLVEAALAARTARIGRIVSMINVPLDTPAARGAPLPPRLIAKALAASHAVIAHNTALERQARSMVRQISVDPSQPTWLVLPGAGVDLARHPVTPLPPIDDGLVFLTVARLDERHGILELADAARQIRAHRRRARFILVGTPSDSEGAIARERLARYADDLEVLEPVDDIRPFLARCHVYIHPARSDGLPRQLLEALAAGRPVITTDTPGCRDTVDERVNGCLVPPRDAGALTLAVESVLKRPDLIPSQARAARLKAERRFDVREVDRVLIASLAID